MNIKSCFVFWISSIFLFLFLIFTTQSQPVSVDEEEIVLLSGTQNSPPCLKMFEFIEHYSKEYGVPKHIAYNVAYKETRYLGPFDWDYNPNQASGVGAVGPMQVMPATSEFINKEKITSQRLKTDIEYNIRTSMKLLNHLHKTYKDWSVVCGVYNTGKVMVNDYALYCVNNKDYKSKWVKPQNQKEEHR